jgi:hypothetical protein
MARTEGDDMGGDDTGCGDAGIVGGSGVTGGGESGTASSGARGVEGGEVAMALSVQVAMVKLSMAA